MRVRFALASVVCGVALASLTGGAAAAAPEELWTRCDAGLEDVQCASPRNVATNRSNGDVYVADQSNDRIVRYSAWGEFERAWGWGVLDGSVEMQACSDAGECLPGIPGGGSGQLNNPQGLTVDSTGSVYAYDLSNRRVQKFDADGNFIFMAGGEVNETKSEEGGSSEAERNLCTAASGDGCRSGSSGTGKGEFSSAGTPTSSLTIGAANKLYVGDKGRIQVFDSSGNYLEDLSDPEGAITSSTVKALATGPAGSIFVALVSKANVLRLNGTSGKLICTAEMG